MEVVPRLVRSREEGDELEALGEPLVDVFRRMVGAAEACSRGALVEHDHVSVGEGLPLRVGQSVEGEVMLPERREQEVSLWSQHPAELVDPPALELLGEVSEDRERIGEVEARTRVR